MVALEEAGVARRSSRAGESRGLDALQAVLGPGDWQVKNKDAEPGGWAFEFRNDFYPDVDDTAFVLMALQPREVPRPQAHGRRHAPRNSMGCSACRNRDGAGGV